MNTHEITGSILPSQFGFYFFGGSSVECGHAFYISNYILCLLNEHLRFRCISRCLHCLEIYEFDDVGTACHFVDIPDCHYDVTCVTWHTEQIYDTHWSISHRCILFLSVCLWFSVCNMRSTFYIMQNIDQKNFDEHSASRCDKLFWCSNSPRSDAFCELVIRDQYGT